MLDRLSLRARLVLGVIVLGAIGLAVANVATYTSLRSFLIDRTDRRCRSPAAGYEHRPRALEAARAGRRPPPGVAAGDFVQVRTANGDVACTWQQSGFGESASPPRLPADRLGRLRPGAPSSPSPREDGDRYRVRASTEPGTGAMLIIATSLADVDATLRRLLLIMLLVTLAVLAALAVLGLWVVRIGLRPLEEIGTTAEAIADGDLTRRVERAESTTEVGRLGPRPERDARVRSRRRSRPRQRPSDGSGASSRTRRTSCGRRSPLSARTPSSSHAARRRTRTTSSAR